MDDAQKEKAARKAEAIKEKEAGNAECSRCRQLTQRQRPLRKGGGQCGRCRQLTKGEGDQGKEAGNAVGAGSSLIGMRQVQAAHPQAEAIKERRRAIRLTSRGTSMRPSVTITGLGSCSMRTFHS
eukprot:1156229-Pelagomonas_calceolata.AAC.11